MRKMSTPVIPLISLGKILLESGTCDNFLLLFFLSISFTQAKDPFTDSPSDICYFKSYKIIFD